MSSSFTFSVHVQDDLPLRSYSEVQPLLTCCTFPSVGQLALQNWFICAATLPKDIFSFSRSSYAKYFLYSSQSAFWRIIVVFWHIGDLLARNPQLQITFIYKKPSKIQDKIENWSKDTLQFSVSPGRLPVVSKLSINMVVSRYWLNFNFWVNCDFTLPDLARFTLCESTSTRRVE